jgi:toxin CcdB
MPKYDVYRDPRGTQNLLLNVQADILDTLETRMAIPLLPEKATKTKLVKKLNPIFEIAGKRYVLATQHMLAVPAAALRDNVGNVRDHSDAVTAAIDFLHQGF